MTHCHALGRRRALVKQRCVRDRQGRKIAHDGLEVQKRLESSLRYLRLVRRVRRVPRGILQDVPQDHGRRVAAVVAHADERAKHLVLRRHAAQLGQRFVLRDACRQRERLLHPYLPGNHVVDEGIHRVETEQPEHIGLVLGRGAVVPGCEARVVAEE